jgi:TonB family protein
MESKALPFSRIRLPLDDPRTLTAKEHQTRFRIAYAEPAYPAEAKLKHTEGTVILDALIDKEGIIQKLSVREGHPVLAESALQAVRHWAYSPTKVNGIPVEVETQLEVIYTLPNSCSG